MLGDPVGDVDEADRAERERAVRHQRHVQGEGEHVGVGRRQVVAQGEAADLGVGGDRGRVGDDAVELQPHRPGSRRRRPGTKGRREAPGTSGSAARA